MSGARVPLVRRTLARRVHVNPALEGVWAQVTKYVLCTCTYCTWIWLVFFGSWSNLLPYLLTLATHRILYPAPAAFLTSKPLASSAPSTKSRGSVKPTTADLPSLTETGGEDDDDDGASVDEVYPCAPMWTPQYIWPRQLR